MLGDDSKLVSRVYDIPPDVCPRCLLLPSTRSRPTIGFPGPYSWGYAAQEGVRATSVTNT